MCHTYCAKPEPMTRDRWLQIVEQSGRVIKEPLIRRQFHRHHADAMVSLTFDSGSGDKEAPQDLLCLVVNVSPGGLMLRSHWEIPPGTPVSIEWYEEDGVVALSGKTKHCTGKVSAFQVGIELEFPSSQDCPPEQTTVSG